MSSVSEYTVQVSYKFNATRVELRVTTQECKRLRAHACARVCIVHECALCTRVDYARVYICLAIDTLSIKPML